MACVAHRVSHDRMSALVTRTRSRRRRTCWSKIAVQLGGARHPGCSNTDLMEGEDGEDGEERGEGEEGEKDDVLR